MMGACGPRWRLGAFSGGRLSFSLCQCTLLSNQHDETLAARNAGINQIASERRIMLSAQWDNNHWIFRALGFVNRGGVAQRQLIRFAEAISDHAPVKDDGQ